MPSDESPLKKLTHIGLVVRDLDKAIKTYESLGMGPFRRFSLPSPDFDFNVLEHFGKPVPDLKYEIAFGSAGPIAIELFQCISGDTIPQRFLDRKGEGLWHYGYDVDDMDETISWMAEKGYEVIARAEYPDGSRMSYFGTDEDLDGIAFQAHEDTQAHVNEFFKKRK